MPKRPVKPSNPTTKTPGPAQIIIDMTGVGVSENPGKGNKIDLTKPGGKPASR